MTSPEPTVPYPPPFWWTKRLAVAAVVILIAIGITRYWWGRVAERRFNEMVAAAHARGEPILVDDFQLPAVPDERNAAFYFRRAAAATSTTVDSPSMSALEFPDYLPYRDVWHTMADKAIAANAAVYPDLRRGRELREFDWGVKWATPMINGVMGFGFNDKRHLANLAGDTALRKHFLGDDAEGLELVADTLALSNAVAQPPTLVNYLVGVGIEALAVDRVQKMAGGLTVAGAAHPSTLPSARPATRQQVQAMIADLLNDAASVGTKRNGFIGERAMQVDSILLLSSESMLLRPMYVLDAEWTGRKNDRYIKATAATHWTAAKNIMGIERPRDPFDLSRVASNMFSGPLDRAVLTGFRVLVDRRIAAIALAMRLYWLDHGRYPDTLDALVPAYLPAVPIDPFSPAGEPFQYILAANGTRPIAYSVGENGIDDTPDESVLPPFTAWGWQSTNLAFNAPRNRKPFDQYRDLSRWMPATPPPNYLPPAELKDPEMGINVSD
ncbi:MAG TPA: hypothetical protein VGN72_08920 [Tepidisphaeraceae bacterium]|nr:hypothetical protein [Tepidisphaeraceae bacterium]